MVALAAGLPVHSLRLRHPASSFGLEQVMDPARLVLVRFWLAVTGLVLLVVAWETAAVHHSNCLNGLSSTRGASGGTIHVVVADPSSPFRRYPALPPQCWVSMLAAAVCLQAAAWRPRQKRGGSLRGSTVVLPVSGVLAFVLAGAVSLVHFTWVDELIHMRTTPTVVPPCPMYYWNDLFTGEYGVSVPPPSWILLIAGTLCLQNAVRNWWDDGGTSNSHNVLSRAARDE